MMITTQHIGSVVREARKAQGLRQEELAAVANVGRRFLSELESGKPGAQLGKVVDVLNALGLDMTLSPRMPPA